MHTRTNRSQRQQFPVGLVPFVLPPIIPLTQNTPCGTGIICPVSAAANTPVKVTHGLGRKVQGMWMMANDGGATVTSGLLFGTTLAGGVNTNEQVTIEAPVVMTNALVFML